MSILYLLLRNINCNELLLNYDWITVLLFVLKNKKQQNKTELKIYNISKTITGMKPYSKRQWL